MVVVLAVGAVVVGGSVVVVRRVVEAVRLEMGVQQVAADLRLARVRAVASAARVRLVLLAGAHSYVRETDTDGGFAADGTRPLPAGIAVASAGSGGTLTFSPLGEGENATVELASADGTRRALVLNQRGRVTLVGR